MKIITMRKTKEEGETYARIGENANDWFCVIETEAELWVYEAYLSEEDKDVREVLKETWDSMVATSGAEQGVKWGEDDIYFYIRPGEPVPAIMQTFELDGDEWERVK